MRVLLDESAPKALGYAIEGHFVRTAQTAGFAGLLNGELMGAMKAANYYSLITFDQNLPYQQNSQLPVAVIVLLARNNRVETALRFVPSINSALQAARVGQLVKLTLD